MLVLIIISLLIILSYSISVCVKYKKIPRSISSTWYSIKHKWWFRFAMWATPMLSIPVIVESSINNSSFLGFISLIGMMLVGCAPDYENDMFQKKIHICGATLLLSGTQIWMIFNCPLMLCVWPVLILYIVIGMLVYKNKSFIDCFYNTNPMFWIEMCAMNVFIALFIKYL